MSPYRVDARLSGRHPFELYILYLAFVSSLPILFGLAPAPGSVREALPTIVSTVWALILAGGSLAALVGIYFRERATGLILEQLGLALVGVGNLIYCVCVLYVVGESGVFMVAIVGGFGVSCLRRYWQIQRILDDVHRFQVQKENES